MGYIPQMHEQRPKQLATVEKLRAKRVALRGILGALGAHVAALIDLRRRFSVRLPN